MSYICHQCGQSHEGIPLSFAADFPDQYADMSLEDRDNRTILGTDQCIIDSEVFYVRGVLNSHSRQRRKVSVGAMGKCKRGGF